MCDLEAPAAKHVMHVHAAQCRRTASVSGVGVEGIIHYHPDVDPAPDRTPAHITAPSGWDQRLRQGRSASGRQREDWAQRPAVAGSRRKPHLVVEDGHGGRKELPNSRLPRRLLGICCC